MSVLVISGTKGQVIKTAPVILEFQRAGVDFEWYSIALHGDRLSQIAESFGLAAPQPLVPRSSDISTVREGVWWAIASLAKILTKKKSRPFDVALIHSDPPPALLAAFYSFRHNTRIAHLEAGERSGRLWEPFPEEGIRRFIDKFSGIHFASSRDSASYKRLSSAGYPRVVDIQCNTLLDSIRSTLKRSDAASPPEKYAMMSVHRLEAITNMGRLETMVTMAELSAREAPLYMPLHAPTRNYLERTGLLQRLQSNKRIRLLPLVPYSQFLALEKNAEFCVTDGGGPQRESFYFGRPCFVVRSISEAMDWPNCVVGGFDLAKFRRFLEDRAEFQIKSPLVDDATIQPARRVAQEFESS